MCSSNRRITLVAHADGVRNPVIARQGRVDLPAEAALAVARRPVDEQAASGGDGQAGQLRGLRRQDQAREGGDHVLRLHRRRVRELPAQHRRIRLQAAPAPGRCSRTPPATARPVRGPRRDPVMGTGLRPVCQSCSICPSKHSFSRSCRASGTDRWSCLLTQSVVKRVAGVRDLHDQVGQDCFFQPAAARSCGALGATRSPTRCRGGKCRIPERWLRQHLCFASIVFLQAQVATQLLAS